VDRLDAVVYIAVHPDNIFLMSLTFYKDIKNYFNIPF
jgi:hypothetical protein